jgi:hypothetical protein
MIQFSAQTTGELPVLTLEFTQRLGSRTIASCAVTAEMYEHTNEIDENPSSTLNGPAVLNAEPFELETETGVITVPPGAAALQAISAGRVIGATYLYRFFATCTDGSKMEEDATQTITKYASP